MTKTHSINSDTATYAFSTRDAAWQFMRDCDELGISAGFPSLDGKHTVQVGIRTWAERETADRFARGAKVISYEFCAA